MSEAMPDLEAQFAFEDKVMDAFRWGVTIVFTVAVAAIGSYLYFS